MIEIILLAIVLTSLAFLFVLVVVGAIGFVYWHTTWLKCVFNPEKLPALRWLACALGLISVFATLVVAFPYHSGLLTYSYSGMDGFYFSLIVTATLIAYALAGWFALESGWVNRIAFKAMTRLGCTAVQKTTN